jgi:Ca-activated chloride channel family protein
LRSSHDRPDGADRHRHSTIGCAAAASRPGIALGHVAVAVLTLGVAVSALQLPQFATTVQVVEVYASVTDARGEPLTGLSQNEFTVREDGAIQTISTFAQGDFPLSVAVGVDRSWSMAGERLALAKAGARTLLAELRPEDQAMVVAIGGSVDTVAPLSGDRAGQAAAVDRLDPWSTTALHDAVIAAIDRVQTGTGRRALVLFSDSNDRYSRADPSSVLDHARGADVMVYPVGLGRERSPLFAELAVLTGGRSFQVQGRDRNEVTTAARTIAQELRTQYLIGYSPSRPRTEGVGDWRSIRVEVRAPGARVRARDGYVNR